MGYQMNLLYGNSLEVQADALLEMAQNSNSKELMIELTVAYKTQNLDALWSFFLYNPRYLLLAPDIFLEKKVS